MLTLVLHWLLEAFYCNNFKPASFVKGTQNSQLSLANVDPLCLLISPQTVWESLPPSSEPFGVSPKLEDNLVLELGTWPGSGGTLTSD